MALSGVRHLPFYDRDVRSGQWHYTSPGKLRRVGTMPLGIIGFGRIGSRLAHIARNLFGRILACDPYIGAGRFPDYVRRVELDELFREADIASAHVPLNDETRGMVDERHLALMKPGSFVVNTARGPVVDVPGVVAGLDAGRLYAAAAGGLPSERPRA